MKKFALSVIASMSILSVVVIAEENATIKNQDLTPPPAMQSTEIQSEPNYYGYNYIGFGVENATYQESGTTSDGKSFKSSATASSPVYTSGGLIKMNNYFDFSIDAASTLMPTQTDEKWQYDGYVKQKNKYDAMQSDLKMLLQIKLNNNHRLAIGPNYNLFTMKRHTYINPVDGSEMLVNGNPIGLNQENIATLNAMIGYIYEHAPFSNGGMRIKAAALYGKPVWNNATNTSNEEVTFSSTKGSTIDLDGYIGFELFKGLEGGFFARYSLKNKNEADTETVGADTVTWPENELETVRYGISFVWNFDTK